MKTLQRKMLIALFGFLGLQAPMTFAAETANTDTGESLGGHLPDSVQTVPRGEPFSVQILAQAEKGADDQRSFAQVAGPDRYPEPDKPLKPGAE